MSKDVLGLKGSQGSPALAHSANLLEAQPTVPASGASGASLASVDHLQPITGFVAKQGAGAVGSYVKYVEMGRTIGRLDNHQFQLNTCKFPCSDFKLWQCIFRLQCHQTISDNPGSIYLFSP